MSQKKESLEVNSILFQVWVEATLTQMFSEAFQNKWIWKVLLKKKIKNKFF